MRKILIFNLLVIAFSLNATAQDKQDFKEIEDTSWKKIYRGVPSKENELVIENSIQNKIVNEFINSNTFNRVKNKINSYGTISSQNVSIDSIIVKDKGTFHYFTIAIKQNNIIKATLDVAVLDNTSNLPYNDKYVMNLNDMTDFDINNLSGKVELYDLNYDNFNHTEVKINNNKIENITYHSPSVQFLNKFVSLKLK